MQGQSVDEMRFAYKMMSSVMTDCGRDCLKDFNTAQFSGNEQQCVSNCAQQSFALTQTLMSQMTQQQWAWIIFFDKLNSNNIKIFKLPWWNLKNCYNACKLVYSLCLLQFLLLDQFHVSITNLTLKNNYKFHLF